jgi:predicted O-linked N-acetylglucosamine transferase (SPINDLY family)
MDAMIPCDHREMKAGWEALDKDDFRTAERIARQALERDANDAEALYLLGSAFLFEGRHAEARGPLGAAAPRIARRGAGFRLGHCLLALGDAEGAEAALRRECEAYPDFADAHNVLGVALVNQSRSEDALAAFLAALRVDPQHAEANNNAANVLATLGRREDAVPHLERALQKNPGLADSHLNLGLLLQSLRRYEEAIASFRRALELAPQLNYALSSLVWCELLAYQWPPAEADVAALRRQVREGKVAAAPFTLIAASDSPGEQRAGAERHVRELLAGKPQPLWRGAARRRERITLAYLSADFHEHATAKLAARLFELHDRRRFEVIGISYGPDDGSPARRRLQQSFDRFVDVRAADDAAAARLLYELQVDIAIDLKGHTPDARPGILARRPAPLQVSYLGYPGTLGAPFIDYVVADRVVIPPGEGRFFSEQVVWLPHSYQVNDATRAIAERAPSRDEAGLPEGAFVFCAFNNIFKITPQFFGVWLRLLAGLPGSVLWLLDDDPTARRNLQESARAGGVDPARLVFAARVPHAEHLARHRLADLFLDNLPCNAHTTASDALWAGLPLLACRGSTFAGRVAASLLEAVGLPELIAPSLERYEALALELARSPGLLGDYRERLARNRLTHPLFDTELFRRHLEAAFETMWQQVLDGEAPRSFSVPARVHSPP